jgi:hypothetical protein
VGSALKARAEFGRWRISVSKWLFLESYLVRRWVAHGGIGAQKHNDIIQIAFGQDDHGKNGIGKALVCSLAILKLCKFTDLPDSSYPRGVRRRARVK